MGGGPPVTAKIWGAAPWPPTRPWQGVAARHSYNAGAYRIEAGVMRGSSQSHSHGHVPGSSHY